MTNHSLYTLWGCLFILCAGLGFLPEPSVGTLLAALAFFFPPAVLLLRRERDTLKLIRNLSALSLGLTAVLLIAAFLTTFRSEELMITVNTLLTIVSTPMLCSSHWALSLFLWSCLLMGSLTLLKKDH